MSVKLSFIRRLVVNLIYSGGFTIMFGIPIYYAVNIVIQNIEYEAGNKLSLNWAVAGAIILVFWGLLYIKYLKKIFHRKLTGLQVRDELGIMPVKGVLGIVVDRLLRVIEFVYPSFITLLLLYVSKYAFSQFIVFEKLYSLNVKFFYLSLIGFGVLLVGDFVKISMMKKQKIEDMLSDKAKQNKLELKRVKKLDKKTLRAIEIEKKLEILKNT